MKEYIINRSNFFSKYYNTNKIDCLAVSCDIPRWHEGLHLRELSPKKTDIMDFRDNNISKSQFIKNYENYLISKYYDKCHSDKGFDSLDILEQLDGKTIVSFEGTDEFSHMDILIDYFKKMGFNVKSRWLN